MSRLVFCLLAAAALPVLAGGEPGWPQFRGPNRDAISSETGLLTVWPAGGPEVLWRRALGDGYSAIAVVAGRLCTMFAEGDEEVCACFDPRSGEELWRTRVDARFKDNWGDGPRSTPTIDGDLVFALSARGKLHALAAADGTARWSKDLTVEYRAEPPRWGVATSPLVEGRLLLVDVGGRNGSSVVAFDKQSGKEVWRSQNDKAGYSAPVGIEVGEVRQVLFFTGTRLIALSPLDGSLFWEVPWRTAWDVNASTPVFVPPDKVFLSTGYDVGSALYRIRTDGPKVDVEQVWKSREMKNKFSSSLYRGGYLYGFDEKTLKCLDARTGEVRWRARGLGHGSLIWADGHLIVLGEEGTLALVEATPEEYREKARAEVLEGRTWTAPALAGGRLYLRNASEMIALGVSDRTPPEAKGEGE